MARTRVVTSFTYPPDDPYASEHALIRRWIAEADASLQGHPTRDESQLRTLASGEAIFSADAKSSCRLLHAALRQIRFWDRQLLELRVRAQQRGGTYGNGQRKVYQVHGYRAYTLLIIRSLLRRTLPLDNAHLLALLDWCRDAESLSNYHAPVAYIVRALDHHASTNTPDDELRIAMHHFARQVRASFDTETKRLASTVERICQDSEPQPDSDAQWLPRPVASAAGNQHIMSELKIALGMISTGEQPETRVLPPDDFACPVNSPLLKEHAFISELLQQIVVTQQRGMPSVNALKYERRMLRQRPVPMGRLLLAAAERHTSGALSPTFDAANPHRWQAWHALKHIVHPCFQSEFEIDRPGAFDLLLYVARLANPEQLARTTNFGKLLSQIESEARRCPLAEGERFVLSLARAALVAGPTLGKATGDVFRMSRLINDGVAFYLAPTESWSCQMNEDLSQMSAELRSYWLNLLNHAITATMPRPSAKWLKTAEKLVAALGEGAALSTFERWFSLVAKGQSVPQAPGLTGGNRAADTIHPENADCLRGLLWCVPVLANRNELLRPVTTVALSAFKKVPGVGPRAPKVGNACVYVLSQLGTKEAVGQLAMLKVRVKSGSAQKEIEKAFEAAADALGLPREEIEELGVPTYGLEEVGRLVETFGDYQAELLVTGTDAELRWLDSGGKSLKSVPAKVKAAHKEELKDLQQSVKDIKAMLPAQRDRLDGMFLLEKSWPLAEWRARYHDHPLVGTIAQRLLWCVNGTPALFREGMPTDVHGAAIAHDKTAKITLWHPIDRSVDEVTAWRNRLEELAVTQPFKQAYREVYLLTDAERNTHTYSNRFAAHIIRQHQFNALCASRGWKNKLRLMVDSTYPPASKTLPHWGLRAEFWVDGIGQNYGVDTNDAGTYLRLATDQVRFYRIAAAENFSQVGDARYISNARGPGDDGINEPLPLADVPPLVFSEIMRDVDLFVGVGSVGNDPTWQDGGPEGRYREYWHNFSFGDLSGTAATRKQVLERLVPRLKIAARCSFSDRFLVVRGDKRTYKIHLGSGNILMEPNDQYLCIVPNASIRGTQDGLYLPFDGDATLSVIISKALLLAEDTKIKDRSIVSQIDKR